MNLFPSLFHHSGGAVYHWRALSHQKRLWNTHLEHVARFLNEWNPQAKSLVLVGPSGGYSLPSSFLARFDSIEAFEPDAMARMIFKLKHGSHLKKFQWLEGKFDFTFEPKPGVAILFCNLLGQFTFGEGIQENADGESIMSEELAQAQDALSTGADSHEIASYHDILSGDFFRFEWSEPMDGDQPFREKFAIEAFDPYIYPMNADATELNISVHHASYLFHEDKFAYQYWEWQITPTQTQVIEGVYTRPR